MRLFKKALIFCMLFGLTVLNVFADPYSPETLLYIDIDNNGSSTGLKEGQTVSGSGFTWDGNSKTLTLNGYNGGYISAPGDLNIIVEGNNTVSPDGYFSSSAIIADGNLTISGSGTLNAVASLYGLEVKKDIIIKDAVVSASGDFYGIYSKKSITFDKAAVTAEGGMAAVLCLNPASSGGEIKVTGHVAAGGKVIEISMPASDGVTIGSNNTPAKKVVIAASAPAVVIDDEPKPVGRTCQDDGYPEGYDWSDAEQACILVSPAQTNRFAVVNTADK